MGSKSKSSNKTSSTAYNFNNVDYGGGGGGSGLAKNLNAVNSNISTGSIYMTTTDHGATREAGNTAREALYGMGEAVGAVERLGSATIEGAYDDASASREFAESVFGDATGFASRTTDRAYDDLADSRAMTFDAFEQAGEWVTGTSGKAMDTLGFAYGDYADRVEQSNKESLQFATQNFDRSLAFANQATRSEAGQVVENLSKIVLLGVGGLGLLFVVANRSK
ncbi:hypothetical protein LL254_04055 [Marinobacter nauticus]|uniref:hypothetical protein n=1 Tax=Marinobacter nauticus TaxID=2743 RepID=UPI001D196E18|nr:hypothetical protein [Marinobacter nauticus]MCC4269870.1 hypothetical protein [Marinobacter nauticus]